MRDGVIDMFGLKNEKYEKYIDKVSGKELKKEINFYGNGEIHREYFYLNNKQHREDGPAFIYYNGDGKVIINT